MFFCVDLHLRHMFFNRRNLSVHLHLNTNTTPKSQKIVRTIWATITQCKYSRESQTKSKLIAHKFSHDPSNWAFVIVQWRSTPVVSFIEFRLLFKTNCKCPYYFVRNHVIISCGERLKADHKFFSQGDRLHLTLKFTQSFQLIRSTKR